MSKLATAQTDSSNVLAAMRQANKGAVNRIKQSTRVNPTTFWCVSGGFTQQAKEIRSILGKTKADAVTS